jgi:uncharacterized protein YbjT (DUF2867 family)
MLEYLTVAKKGKVKLFGSGEYRINPIHGRDLAAVCLDALDGAEPEVTAGGPEIFSHREIARLAFDVLHKDARISCMPLWQKNIFLRIMKLFTSSKTYGPVEFLMTAVSMDGVAPSFGEERLRDFFEKNA